MTKTGNRDILLQLEAEVVLEQPEEMDRLCITKKTHIVNTSYTNKL